MNFLFSRVILISLFFFYSLSAPTLCETIKTKNNNVQNNKTIQRKETNNKPLTQNNIKQQNSKINILREYPAHPQNDMIIKQIADNVYKQYSKENWELFNKEILEFDKIESSTKKNENITTQVKEIKKQTEDVLETYAGMVGDKRLGKGLLLDIAMEEKHDGSWLLVITGNNIENTKLVNTYLQNIPTRFLMDVNIGILPDKIVNFTYQMPKDIRLKYGNQTNGYRIAIDLPNGTKIIHKKISKNEISIKLLNPEIAETYNKKQEQQKLQYNPKTINNKNVKFVNTNVKNYENIQYLSKDTNFKKIHLGEKRQLKVAIDAGHGGIDSGATSIHGVLEKHITLKYAKKLKEKLEKQGVKVIMTREGDKTIGLLNRVKIAKEGKADLFISLHADAHDNPKIEGTTVYKLAHLDTTHPDWQRFYNKSYLPNQYNDYVNNKSVLDILVGMAHQSILEKSSIMVDNILLIFKHQEVCKKCKHGQRSLAVLRGLDMTSILIEIGYITNKNEEKKMLLESNIEKFSKILAEVIINTFVE